MQHGLSLTGDLFWIAALAVMAGCSNWAWPKIKPGARVPIHWNRAGAPTLRLGKGPALTGLVVILYVALKMIYDGWVDPVIGLGHLFGWVR